MFTFPRAYRTLGSGSRSSQVELHIYKTGNAGTHMSSGIVIFYYRSINMEHAAGSAIPECKEVRETFIMGGCGGRALREPQLALIF